MQSICGIGNSSQQTSMQCLSTINTVLSDEDKILIKTVGEGVHSKEVDRRISREKLNKATKLGVNKLLEKVRGTGTVDRRPGSSRLRSAHTEENVETVTDLVLNQENKPQTHSTVREISRRRIHRCTQNAICLHFLPYLLNICSKTEFLISEGSVATCLK